MFKFGGGGVPKQKWRQSLAAAQEGWFSPSEITRVSFSSGGDYLREFVSEVVRSSLVSDQGRVAGSELKSMVKEGGPSQPRSGKEDVGDLLKRLDLHEEEEDEYVWEEEVSTPEIQLKWLAIAKVHTVKGFSPFTPRRDEISVESGQLSSLEKD